MRAAGVLLGLLETAAVGYAIVLGGLFLAQRMLLYIPDRTRPQLGGLAALGVREIALTTADGLKLNSWYLPAPPGRLAILYLHGNGGHIGYRGDALQRFAHEGWGALFLDYRGYGGNPGSPDETGLYRDARAAAEFLDKEGVAPDRLVVYGESLGAAIAVQLASERRVGGLVLEAPFTRLADAAQYHYPFVPAAWLVRDRFDSLAKIGTISAPLLVLHGSRDTVVPERFGRAVLAAAPGPKEGWFAAAGGHNDLASLGGLDAVAAFLRRLD